MLGFKYTRTVVRSYSFGASNPISPFCCGPASEQIKEVDPPQTGSQKVFLAVDFTQSAASNLHHVYGEVPRESPI
jgi:hypothetical protein